MSDNPFGAEPQIHRFTVAPDRAGERLDRWLAGCLPSMSRSRLKQLIEGGNLESAGSVLRQPSRKVLAGERFVLAIPPTAAAEPEAQALPLAVVYEDAEVIVVDKPAGLVVHPAPGNPDRTLVNALLAHCGESLRGIGGVARPGIVHRLDKDTSGLMVVAKTERAQATLSAQFADRSIARSYHALVWGTPQPLSGRIEGNIGRSPKNRKKMAIVQRGGKPAATGYKVLASYRDSRIALVECRLETGRTHQIRVHLTAKGHPLLGDPFYGRGGTAARLKPLPGSLASEINALEGQMLHARVLGFRHPISEEPLTFESPYPPVFKGLLDNLGGQKIKYD